VIEYLVRSVEEKKIIWFKPSNQYSLLELPAFEVIIRLLQGENTVLVSQWCSVFYQLPLPEAERFVREIGDMLAQQTTPDKASGSFNPENPFRLPSHYYSRRFYKAGSAVFAVDFESEDLEYMLHPKFAHLETAGNMLSDYHFSVFRHNGEYVLTVEEMIIGKWPIAEAHYFTGKFSMELLNRMYKKTDADWIGVFHASAISFKEQCVMFLGDSGSGKSTIAAILMSAGFNMVADDFVPVENCSGEVFHFPAAVSVKKKAVDLLSPQFPQLLEAKEYTYPGVGKTVRYLATPHNPLNAPFGFPCKALVYVKYQQGSGLILNEISKTEAFQYLVPDSWLSPLPENASKFLDWFLAMPCYRLTYSDNEKMVTAVRELFDHE
jgi:hypothetical protein